jgi:hypothetical protein
LATDEQGVASLSLFDQSERQRASLDASEVAEQIKGLGVFDANGRLQIAMGRIPPPRKATSIAVVSAVDPLLRASASLANRLREDER